MHYFILSVILIIPIFLENSFATELPPQECLLLDKVENDSPMHNAKICKIQSNLCTLTLDKVTESGMKYSYTPDIPCDHFESFKVVYSCTLKYKNTLPNFKEIHKNKKMFPK